MTSPSRDQNRSQLSPLGGIWGEEAPQPDAALAVQEPDGPAFRFLNPPVEPDEIGRLAQYRILSVLGQGGMGIVFHAEDVQLQRPVALKLLRPEGAGDLTSRSRLLREARAAAAVKSDHIVTIYQVGMDNDVPFLAMEFLQGESLDSWLARGCRPALPEIYRLGRELALGLAAAHAKGLIHRDVKPTNIWLESPTGRVKLLDFGLVRSDRDPAKLTQSGLVLGTPAYMAPEQARGELLDARCDLFSLGVVLYRLCTGTVPFAGETTMALLTALAVRDPRPVRELNSSIPLELAALVECLLAKDPAKRPPSAQAVADTLQTMAARAEVSPVRDEVVTPVASSVFRAALPAQRPLLSGRAFFRWGALALGLLLAAGALGVLVGGSLLTGRGGRESASANPTTPVPDTVKEAPPAPKKAPDAGEEWLRRVAVLREPAEQVKAVVARLQQLNPGFDGKVTHTEQDGIVTRLEFQTDQVTNLAPLRALTCLQSLNCTGSERGKGQLADLSPLRGLPLTELVCARNQVSDLSPLEGMKLYHLDVSFCPRARNLAPLRGMPLADLTLYCCPGVVDLTPLEGMKLSRLDLGGTDVADLKPLHGMALTCLNLFGCNHVRDLTPLQGNPLRVLNITFCRQVSDLTPLRGLPLVDLSMEGCDQAEDVTPLADLKLTTLILTPSLVKRGLPELRRLESLKLLDTKSPPRLSAQEFWNKLDAGELK
jgi:hypothetical protein